MKILVLNSGSSSIKYQLLDTSTLSAVAKGQLQQIGEPLGRITHQRFAEDGTAKSFTEDVVLANHQSGVQHISDWLSSQGLLPQPSELAAVVHRVAHGGADFQTATQVDEKVLASIRRQIPLAPLHNPANLLGIEVTTAQWPNTPQVAVFDTAFHQTLSEHAYRYGLPLEIADEHRIRRYGFHGTSFKHVSERTARLMGTSIESLNLIVLHLGNGASAAAIAGGRSVDTSMGMTPLEGLLMGTRCGDLDPGIPGHLAPSAELTPEEIDSLLTRQSGLEGLCGHNDMRKVLAKSEAGNAQATLAVEMYCYRIKKYVGAYTAVLSGVDALVFTAGIGENSPEVRCRVCQGLGHLGIRLDETENKATHSGAFAVHAKDSAVQIWVVPTNEELEMAKQAMACLAAEL